jgi:hypothetical protein
MTNMISSTSKVVEEFKRGLSRSRGATPYPNQEGALGPRCDAKRLRSSRLRILPAALRGRSSTKKMMAPVTWNLYPRLRELPRAAPRIGEPAPSKKPKSYQFPALAVL